MGIQTSAPAAGAAPIPLTYLDTDVTLAANSDAKVASQKAVKAYVAAHAASGGVIGTANFDSGGAVTNLVSDGVISGVTYTDVGKYAVTFSPNQANVNYVAQVLPSGEAGGVAGSPNTKAVGGFTAECFFFDPDSGSVAADPPHVQIVITRLSQ